MIQRDGKNYPHWVHDSIVAVLDMRNKYNYTGPVWHTFRALLRLGEGLQVRDSQGVKDYARITLHIDLTDIEASAILEAVNYVYFSTYQGGNVDDILLTVAQDFALKFWLVGPN